MKQVDCCYQVYNDKLSYLVQLVFSFRVSKLGLWGYSQYNVR